MHQSDIDFFHLRAFLALFGPWAVFGQQRPIAPDLRRCQVSATAVIRSSRLTDGNQPKEDLWRNSSY